MLRNMNIRTRLLAGYLAIAALTVLIGGLGSLSLHRMKRADVWIFEKTTAPLEQMATLQGQFQYCRFCLLQAMAEPEAARSRDWFSRAKMATGAMHEALATYASTLIDPTDAENCQRMNQGLARLEAHVADLEGIRAGRWAGTAREAWGPVFLADEEAYAQLLATVTRYNVSSSRLAVDQNLARAEAAITAMSLSIAAGVLLALGLGVLITRSIVGPVTRVVQCFGDLSRGSEEKMRVARAIADGDLSREVTVGARIQVPPWLLRGDETGELLAAAVNLSASQAELDGALQAMTGSLRQARQEAGLTDWLKTGINSLERLLRGDRDPAELGQAALTFLCGYLDAGVGVLCAFHEETGALRVLARYAGGPRSSGQQCYELGEGLLGQAALDRKVISLDRLPEHYLPVASGLGEATPRQVLAMPLEHDQTLSGALELGFLRDLRPIDLELLERAGEALAVALAVGKARQRVRALLEQSQVQEEELRVQQEELQQSNEELEARAGLLEAQRARIQAQNAEVEAASQEIRRRSDEVARISAYKSEFLANMSHELRTPLNSMMILSNLLGENKDGNLSPRQVEFARTIQGSGQDLLNLINDILDLAKLEAGRVVFDPEEIQLTDLAGQLRAVLSPLADAKGLVFQVELEAALPASLRADRQRVDQILRNLVANAVKFTAQGAVTLRVALPEQEDQPLAVPAIAFAVTDTGIGIAKDKHSIIFQAFQQADGTTSRKFGGTGLGLSISQQLAQGMGGAIQVESEPGQGSTFTLFLPLTAVATALAPEAQDPAPRLGPAAAPCADDRDTLGDGDRAILIIEDDPAFAAILATLVRDRGFKVLAAADGLQGLALARDRRPSAIILDVMLPGMDGWSVMDKLSEGTQTRHIPVHFLTCLDERNKALDLGADGFTRKPVTLEDLEGVLTSLEAAVARVMRRLLILEDDPGEAQALVAILAARDLTIQVVASGEEAVRCLALEAFDGLVVDLGQADDAAFAMLEHLHDQARARGLPVIIHSRRELAGDEQRRLERTSDRIIIQGAKSPERLLNEVTLFLHVVETGLPGQAQAPLRASQELDAVLEGRTVLVVDDDMRNLFALTSVLASKRMVSLEADNGLEALAALERHPEVDLVLMDVMMPELDGYQAMALIREQPRFRDLPIIALTAKAMKGDRDACLRAGASDYLAKPLDLDKLLSMMRVWLCDRR